MPEFLSIGTARRTLVKYERLSLQDKQGRVEQMNFAVFDTVKWDDHGNDNHSRKNICIPMNKGCYYPF